MCLQSWLEKTCWSNDWKHECSPIVWRELIDRGGKGKLLGGMDEFLEYAQVNTSFRCTLGFHTVLCVSFSAGSVLLHLSELLWHDVWHEFRSDAEDRGWESAGQRTKPSGGGTSAAAFPNLSHLDQQVRTNRWVELKQQNFCWVCGYNSKSSFRFTVSCYIYIWTLYWRHLFCFIFILRSDLSSLIRSCNPQHLHLSFTRSDDPDRVWKCEHSFVWYFICSCRSCLARSTQPASIWFPYCSHLASSSMSTPSLSIFWTSTTAWTRSSTFRRRLRIWRWIGSTKSWSTPTLVRPSAQPTSSSFWTSLKKSETTWASYRSASGSDTGATVEFWSRTGQRESGC